MYDTFEKMVEVVATLAKDEKLQADLRLDAARTWLDSTGVLEQVDEPTIEEPQARLAAVKAEMARREQLDHTD